MLDLLALPASIVVGVAALELPRRRLPVAVLRNGQPTAAQERTQARAATRAAAKATTGTTTTHAPKAGAAGKVKADPVERARQNYERIKAQVDELLRPGRNDYQHIDSQLHKLNPVLARAKTVYEKAQAAARPAEG